MLYAVDSDDVLFELNAPLQRFKVELDRKKGIYHTKVLDTSEIFDYNLGRVWGCPLEEAFEIVDAFFNSEYFETMVPVPGAQKAIGRLDEEGHDLIVVTSRPGWMQYKTLDQIAEHYPGRFQDALFSGEWSKNPNSGKSKGEICRDIGAERIVDDRFKYCNDAIRFLEKAYLLDLDGKYAWNHKNGLILPAGIQRVKSWEEIIKEELGN